MTRWSTARSVAIRRVPATSRSYRSIVASIRESLGIGRQARRGIAQAGKAPRRRRVERQLDAAVELSGGKALEIRALPAGHVDDLDVFAGADEIGIRRRPVDADVLQRVGQRLRQHDLAGGPQHGTLDSELDGRGGVLRIGCTLSSWMPRRANRSTRAGFFSARDGALPRCRGAPRIE